MSEEQVAELYELLVKARQSPPLGVFHRGWNAALDFAINKLRQVGEDPDTTTEPPEQLSPIDRTPQPWWKNS